MVQDVKTRNVRKRRQAQNETVCPIQRHLSMGLNATVQIGPQDVSELQKSSAETRFLVTSSFYESLICHLSDFCKKRRYKRIKSLAAEHFDQRLDIRSFVRVHTNLESLISVLLNKKQRVLLSLNRAHSIATQQDEVDAEANAAQLCDQASKAEIAELLGYSVETPLDRKLLLGVFGGKPAG